jgi:hypothetical protein
LQCTKRIAGFGEGALRAAILDVVVELLTLLLHVREIPGSNLGPEIVNPN